MYNVIIASLKMFPSINWIFEQTLFKERWHFVVILTEAASPINVNVQFSINQDAFYCFWKSLVHLNRISYLWESRLEVVVPLRASCFTTRSTFHRRIWRLQWTHGSSWWEGPDEGGQFRGGSSTLIKGYGGSWGGGVRACPRTIL